MDSMTKKELWQRFIKSGRVSDYLAYAKAQENDFAPTFPREDLSAEFAEEFINNFDVDFPAMPLDDAPLFGKGLTDDDHHD